MEIEKGNYRGNRRLEDPFIIDWIINEKENPLNWNYFYRWMLTIFVSFAATVVIFCSSVYVGEFAGLYQEFGSIREIIILGISLNVLGFALGPLIWAPFSEVFGRRIIFLITFLSLTAFNLGSIGSKNIWTHLILRFFAGAFGSSSFANVNLFSSVSNVYLINELGWWNSR